MNKINILIITKQDDGNDKNEIKNHLEGNYYKANNEHYFEYTENFNSDLVKNTIKISKDSISIEKTGPINTKMVFKIGEKYHTKYNTPYGSFFMDIDTLEISSSIEDNNKKSNIKLKYEVYIDQNYKILNELVLNVQHL